MNDTTRVITIDSFTGLDMDAVEAEKEAVLARVKAAKEQERKQEAAAFLARILRMKWLAPLRGGKHRYGKIMKAKHAKQYARKRSKMAKASRRRNRGQ